MNDEEIPLLIPCNHSAMVGILHKPAQTKKTGVLIVPAGGPQYRIGCARQIIFWSRCLAREGYPVLRFDYRGFGDSAGNFRGFEQIDDDIAAALDAFMKEVATLDSIILWGECNAASALLMYAWRDSRIKAMILQNPWVRDDMTQARTYIKHYYLMRIMQKSFWLKLLRFQFNPLKSLVGFTDLLKRSKNIPSKQSQDNFARLASFQEKMREGLARFNGQLLLFMSGYSLIGKEFDELVAVSPRWQTVLAEKALTRIDEPNADHTFSRVEDREKLIGNVIKWLATLSS